MAYKYTLSQDSINYIKNTNNLCVYKLSSRPILSNIFFPNVTTLTVINCDKYGVTQILNQEIIPNIKRINYLSTNPGDYLIHERLYKGVEWIFPDKKYDFYEYMISNGLGKKEPGLISQYIKNKTIVDGKHNYDISLKCDLQIPGLGIVNDEWWREQFELYIHSRQNKTSSGKKYSQEFEERMLEKRRVSSILANIDIDELK